MTPTHLLATHQRVAECQAVAKTLDVPAEVVEFLFGLAEDFPEPRDYRVVRCDDRRAVERFERAAHAAWTGEYQEFFTWDGVRYLIGFTFGG